MNMSMIPADVSASQDERDVGIRLALSGIVLLLFGGSRKGCSERLSALTSKGATGIKWRRFSPFPVADSPKRKREEAGRGRFCGMNSEKSDG
jgi:hypothetical protein